MALTTTTPTHEYTIQYTSIWSSNMLFLLPPSPYSSFTSSSTIQLPIFSAQTAELSPSQPDITLSDLRGRAKTDITGPVIAVAHFRATKHIHLGLGDPAAGLEKMKWAVMKNESIWSHSSYRFQLGGGGQDSNTQQKKQVQQQIRNQNLATTTTFIPSTLSIPNHTHPRLNPQHTYSYTWKRTHSTTNGIHGLEKLSSEHYKLQANNDGTDQTIAVLLSDSWKFRKAGKLRVRDGLVWELEIAVVLSAATLTEMMRRRNATMNAVTGGISSVGTAS